MPHQSARAAEGARGQGGCRAREEATAAQSDGGDRVQDSLAGMEAAISRMALVTRCYASRTVENDRLSNVQLSFYKLFDIASVKKNTFRFSCSLALCSPQEEINAEKRRAQDEQKKSRIIILPDEIAPNANMRKVDIEAVRSRGFDIVRFGGV